MAKEQSFIILYYACVRLAMVVVREKGVLMVLN